jgi:hypothetical protein
MLFLCTLNGRSQSNKLKVFIVSDAHFGWVSTVQPSLAKQQAAIDQIRAKFPDLDLFIDTGDNCHDVPGSGDGRSNWSDIVMYQKKSIPFFFVTGNHEVIPSNADNEKMCAEVGSMEFRPYYSFDVKGIHFVAIPELIHTIFLCKEIMEWLKLDLEVNKDKTTILLSHNSLLGAANAFEEGYRGLVNSAEILALINQYPNVIAWMYGHDHGYLLYPKNGKLFVANGRIGGFDPSNGLHGLGGIYLEIDKTAADFRPYSAEFDKFIDQISGTAYRSILPISSSFDANAKPSYSIGMGGARDGSKVATYNHLLTGDTDSELFIRTESDSIINDDPDFLMYQYRAGSKDKQLMGGTVSVVDSFQWNNPGVLINANSKPPTVLTVPRSAFNQISKYWVAPGKKYSITTIIDGKLGGQTLIIRGRIYDTKRNLVFSVNSNLITLKAGVQTIVQYVDVPPITAFDNIYFNDGSDTYLHLSTLLDFRSLPTELVVKRVALKLDNPTAGKSNGLILNGKSFLYDGDLKTQFYKNMLVPTDTSVRKLIEVSAGNKGRLTWLLRKKNIDWQILGAQAKINNEQLLIGPMRNTFTFRNEVVLNPVNFQTDSFYVQKIRNINKLIVTPRSNTNGQIKVVVQELLPGQTQGEVEVYKGAKKVIVSGGVNYNTFSDRIIANVKAGDTLTIYDSLTAQSELKTSKTIRIYKKTVYNHSDRSGLLTIFSVEGKQIFQQLLEANGQLSIQKIPFPAILKFQNEVETIQMKYQTSN